MGEVRICCEELSDSHFALSMYGVASGEAMEKEDRLGEWKLLKLSHRKQFRLHLPTAWLHEVHVERLWCQSNQDNYQVHILPNYCYGWMYSSFIQTAPHNSASASPVATAVSIPAAVIFSEQVDQSCFVPLISKKILLFNTKKKLPCNFHRNISVHRQCTNCKLKKCRRTGSTSCGGEGNRRLPHWCFE